MTIDCLFDCVTGTVYETVAAGPHADRSVADGNSALTSIDRESTAPCWLTDLKARRSRDITTHF